MKINIFFRLEKAWVGTRQKLVSSNKFWFCSREKLNLHDKVTFALCICDNLGVHMRIFGKFSNICFKCKIDYNISYSCVEYTVFILGISDNKYLL